jgi:hypothetical protein
MGFGSADTVLGASVAAFAERTALDVDDFGAHKVLRECFSAQRAGG